MGEIKIDEKITLHYDEYGSGDRVIMSAQVGFYPVGMQQKLAEMGYHVYCITLRGFAPSSYVTVDYGDGWYDVFADDVATVADKLGIGKFTYMGASHGAGVGWHIMLRHQEKVNAFVAVVPGPHSLSEGTMSYRQMMEQGIIKSLPPFNPPIDLDDERQKRRDIRASHIANNPPADPREKAIDYGRPLMRLGNEERLCAELSKITVPTLIIGGTDDPISTPELMMRTAKCLPHCKMIIYSNCGHDIDTDIIEEVCDETDRFIKNVYKTGRCYAPVISQSLRS